MWCACLHFEFFFKNFFIHNNNESPVQLAPIRFHCYSFAFGRYIIAPNLVILQLHVVIPFVSRTCIFCLAQWPTHDVFPPKPNNLKVMFGPRMKVVLLLEHIIPASLEYFFFNLPKHLFFFLISTLIPLMFKKHYTDISLCITLIL